MVGRGGRRGRKMFDRRYVTPIVASDAAMSPLCGTRLLLSTVMRAPRFGHSTEQSCGKLGTQRLYPEPRMQLGGSVFVAEQNMHDSLCVPSAEWPTRWLNCTELHSTKVNMDRKNLEGSAIGEASDLVSHARNTQCMPVLFQVAPLADNGNLGLQRVSSEAATNTTGHSTAAI